MRQNSFATGFLGCNVVGSFGAKESPTLWRMQASGALMALAGERAVAKLREALVGIPPKVPMR